MIKIVFWREPCVSSHLLYKIKAFNKIKADHSKTSPTPLLSRISWTALNWERGVPPAPSSLILLRTAATGALHFIVVSPVMRPLKHTSTVTLSWMWSPLWKDVWMQLGCCVPFGAPEFLAAPLTPSRSHTFVSLSVWCGGSFCCSRSGLWLAALTAGSETGRSSSYYSQPEPRCSTPTATTTNFQAHRHFHVPGTPPSTTLTPPACSLTPLLEMTHPLND